MTISAAYRPGVLALLTTASTAASAAVTAASAASTAAAAVAAPITTASTVASGSPVSEIIAAGAAAAASVDAAYAVLAKAVATYMAVDQALDRQLRWFDNRDQVIRNALPGNAEQRVRGIAGAHPPLSGVFQLALPLSTATLAGTWANLTAGKT